MAVIKTTGALAKPRDPMYGTGKAMRKINAQASLVAASMANGDILELAGPFTFDSRIDRVFSPNATPALTAATDSKLGFFKKNADGSLSVIKSGSDALLWTGATLATSLSARDLLMSFTPALDRTKSIGELLAMGRDQEVTGGVWLGLTFPTKPSVNGTLDLDIEVEEATRD